MKKRLCLFLFLFPLIVFSQKPTYVLGPVYKTSKGVSDFSVLYTSDNETIILQGGTKGFGFGIMTTLAIGVPINFSTLTIEKYDSNFKLVKTVKARNTFGKDLLFLGTIEADNIQHLILADADNKKIDIYKAEINPETLLLNAEPVQIASLAISSKKDDDLMFTWSPDRTKMVFVARNAKQNYKDKKLSIQVLDKNFKPLWSSQSVLPVNDAGSIPTEISMNNDGHVFVIVKKLWTKKQGKKYSLEHYFTLFKVNREAVKEITLNIDKYELNNASIACLPAKLVIQGYCFDGGDGGGYRTTAIAYYTLQVSNELVPGKGEVTYFTGQGENLVDPAKKYDPENPVLESTTIDTRSKSYYPNGDCLIAAEVYKFGMISNTVRVMTFTHYTYSHTNLLLVYIRADGSVKFAKRIIKNQYQHDENLYASVVESWKDNKTIFLYNDSRLNLADKNEIKSAIDKFEESQLVAVTVDDNGNIKKYKCIDNAANETCIIPADCGSVREGEVIVVGSRFHRLAKTEVQVGKVVFK
jgi:hypothetical protein